MNEKYIEDIDQMKFNISLLIKEATNGMKQSDIADVLHIKQSQVSLIKNGKVTGLSIEFLISAAMNLGFRLEFSPFCGSIKNGIITHLSKKMT